MSKEGRRLGALNLALLLIFLMAAPVQAAPLASAGSSSGESYRIFVGDERFWSDETASGNGWSYADGTLTLNGYQGEDICASGDLTILSSGNVSIKCPDDYSGSGLNVDGTLLVVVKDGTFDVCGGSTANGYTGNAVRAAVFGCRFCEGTYGRFVAGSTNRSGAQAKDAILTGRLLFIADNVQEINYFIAGGSAPYSFGSIGGCGINAIDVTVNASGTISGGNGYSPGPAVYYSSSCNFGLANISLQSGHSSRTSSEIAIMSDSSAEGWSKDINTTAEKSSSRIEITINKYKVTLYGEGGTRGSATFTSLQEYYPASYDLSEYTFTRDGYIQTGWRNASGDLVPLDKKITPVKNTWFDAVWEKSEQQFSTDYCVVKTDRKEKAVTVTQTADWYDAIQNNDPEIFVAALYEREGRMIGLSSGAFSASGESSVRIPYSGSDLPLVKVYAIDMNDRPAGANVTMDLKYMQPD